MQVLPNRISIVGIVADYVGELFSLTGKEEND